MKLLWWLFGWTFRNWRFWRQYRVTSFTLSAVGALCPGVIVLVRQKAREIWLPAAKAPQELMEIHRLIDSQLLVPRWTKGTFDMKKLRASAESIPYEPPPVFSLSETCPDPLRELMVREKLTDADAEKLSSDFDPDAVEFLPSKPSA